MLTQAGRLLGIFKSCAPVPAGEPRGAKGTLVAWAVLLGRGGWQLEEALPLQTASRELPTVLELTAPCLQPLTKWGPDNLGNLCAIIGTS